MAYRATIPIFDAFPAWRDNARRFALHGIKPDDIHWSREGDTAGFFDSSSSELKIPDGTLTVPRDFISLAGEAVCLDDGKCFSLLYRVLLRLQKEAMLLTNHADPDVNELYKMSKEVHRDCHKMKAFVRFKEIDSGETARRQFVAWFEPDNFIVEHAAPFFARRFADMDWVIITPKGTAKFIGGLLSYTVGDQRPAGLTDQMDELWRAYYASIFNPARLKVKSMQSHMPKKYWKNLPEAGLIPELIASAEIQSQAMRDKAPSMASRNLHKFKAPAFVTQDTSEALTSLEAARAAARQCQRCPLFATATQTVFGEGNPDAEIMFVGEQPGDQEDLAGRPFIGPAGKIFDDALTGAGIDRAKVYVTNAVKHFKFEPRGKRRIHQRPSSHDIAACEFWLKHELDFIKPGVVVAMGASAIEALTGDGKGVMKRRGQFEHGAGGQRVLITYHPSAILRAPDPDQSAKMKAEFFADIAQLGTAKGVV